MTFILTKTIIAAIIILAVMAALTMYSLMNTFVPERKRQLQNNMYKHREKNPRCFFVS